MCLILVAIEAHSKYPLVIAANRDEFYDRPTAAASFWPEARELFAGRDLRAGGTWLGITRTGRIAALTNYRDPDSNRPDAPSRGNLVSDFLLYTEPPLHYLQRLSGCASRFNGFNLLAGNQEGLYWYSNRASEIRRLSAGIHGLSNHLLDTPWPKIRKGEERLMAILSAEEVSAEDIFRLLADRAVVEDKLLPDTGVGIEWERILSPIFIASQTYGTRSSTVIIRDRSGNVTFIERSFEKGSEKYSTAEYTFATKAF